MSNNESTVESEEEQTEYLKINQPSFMTKLADSLREEGIKAQVVKKLKFQ